MIQTIVIALVMFAVLVAVHEWGHFIAAKAVGIRVDEFSIGMGPKLLSVKKGETLYTLRALPVGGFVAMEGEDEDQEGAAPSPTSFLGKKLWQRMLVVAAGVLMNFLLAFVLMAGLYFVSGMPSTVIQETEPGSPAAGLLFSGETILEINGQEVDRWQDISSAIASCQENEIQMKVLSSQGNEVRSVTVPVAQDETGKNMIGIYAKNQHHLGYSIAEGFKATFVLCGVMIEAIQMLFTGQVGMEEVVGPVGVVSIVGDFAGMGLFYLVLLTAMISVNLAFVNILPLPALDGGKLLFMLLPVITGRKIRPETEMKWTYGGFLLLIGLTVLITIKDVNQFIFGLF